MKLNCENWCEFQQCHAEFPIFKCQVRPKKDNSCWDIHTQFVCHMEFCNLGSSGFSRETLGLLKPVPPLLWKWLEETDWFCHIAGSSKVEEIKNSCRQK